MDFFYVCIRHFRLSLAQLLQKISALRYKHFRPSNTRAAGKVVLAPWGISLGSWVMFVRVSEGGNLSALGKESELTLMKFCATL